MSNIWMLIGEAENEGYRYFDQHIRRMPRNDLGKIDHGLPGFADNDVDAFRHAYVSGRYTQEFGAGPAKILGDIQDFLAVMEVAPTILGSHAIWTTGTMR